MNEITTRQLQSHISSYLKNLPLKLIRRNKPVAVVISWLAWEKLAKYAEENRDLTKGLAEGRCTRCSRWAEKLTVVVFKKQREKLCRFCFEGLKEQVGKEGGEVSFE